MIALGVRSDLSGLVLAAEKRETSLDELWHEVETVLKELYLSRVSSVVSREFEWSLNRWRAATDTASSADSIRRFRQMAALFTHPDQVIERLSAQPGAPPPSADPSRTTLFAAHKEHQISGRSRVAASSALRSSRRRSVEASRRGSGCRDRSPRERRVPPGSALAPANHCTHTSRCSPSCAGWRRGVFQPPKRALIPMRVRSALRSEAWTPTTLQRYWRPSSPSCKRTPSRSPWRGRPGRPALDNPRLLSVDIRTLGLWTTRPAGPVARSCALT
jgi:hypothetical protein